MKRIFLILLLIVLVAFIYFYTFDNKIYYLALGDEISSNDIIQNVSNFYKKKSIHEKTIVYTKNNYRTVDLINDIEDNKKIDGHTTINNALIKADVVTLSIGFNDFVNYLDDYVILKENLFNLKSDMKNLLEILRKQTKEKLILIGIYNPNYLNTKVDSILLQLNNMYKELANEYNIYYIDIYDEVKDNFYLNRKRLNTNGYNIIKEKLINYVQNVII